jgi:hypothetical protein
VTLWIRVDTDVADNPKIGRFAARLGLDVETTLGHLVRVWGKMAEQKSDGSLRGVTGMTIESWANWRGKKGHFAEAFRRAFVVKGGVVKGWGERQGKLVLRQIADALRKREGRSRDIPRNVRGQSDAVPALTSTKTKPEERGADAFGHDPTTIGPIVERFVAKTGRQVRA